MTPRGKNEAETVKAIIKFFKFHMAPKTSDANLFLKAPNIFKIEYFNKGQQHTGINLIKDCALQSCTVNYTPDGTYMSYEDGAMFSYDLQLQFMELIPYTPKITTRATAQITQSDTHKWQITSLTFQVLHISQEILRTSMTTQSQRPVQACKNTRRYLPKCVTLTSILLWVMRDLIRLQKRYGIHP